MEDLMNTVAVNSKSRSHASSFVSALRAVLAKVSSIATAIKNRREINQLANADAAMLRDLGISPSDIDGALSQPFWHDPSAHLVEAQMSWRRATKAAKHDNLVGLSR
jgi:uncharacterized protein YjiS (DUF1127 family)